mgnify:FL=1|tara:strand:- start:2441 stop:4126 length:1686 start_codon:yes stop_codon:yes gene_type:complete
MANIIDIVVRAKDSTAGAFKKVSASAEKLKAGLAKGFGGAAKAAKGLAVAVALVGTAVIAAAKNFIGFGSAAEEISTKFDAVFASSKTAADAIANDLAASFDLADSTAKEMLANIGDLLTGFGFTGAEALEMADKVSRLGIDLASFTNYSKGASGATEALTKLLLGESEQAKSLGIVVRQGSDEYKNAVKAKQADLGVSLLQAKAMTALEMAVNQSNNAIGDYARTQEGVANRQRKANEAFKQAKEDIGLAIIAHSSYGDILNMVAEKTKELTESGLIELWAENVAKAVEWLIPIVEKLGKAFGFVKEKIQQGAAFAGALSAGSSVAEAIEIAKGMPEQIKRENKERLDGILKEKAAKKEAAAEENRRKEADALAKEKADRAAKEQYDAEKKAADSAAEAADNAAKQDKQNIKDNEKLLQVQKDLDRIKDEDRQKMFLAAGAAGAANIEVMQGKIEGLAMNKEDRRAQERAQRDIDADQDREDDIRKRMKKRGLKLSKDDQAFIEMKDLQKAIVAAQKQKAQDEKNAQDLADKLAQQARENMVKELRLTKEVLIQNLGAGA